MFPRISGTAALLILLGVAAAHLAVNYPSLPDTMVSHFGADGRANGWMSKEGFAIFYAVLLLFMTVIFAGLPAMLGNMPPELVNLPNKAYWLAPERRQETMRAISDSMAWFGVLTNAFLIVMIHITFIANRDGSGRLDNGIFLPLLIGYLVLTGVWTVRLLMRFGRP